MSTEELEQEASRELIISASELLSASKEGCSDSEFRERVAEAFMIVARAINKLEEEKLNRRTLITRGKS